MRRRSAPGPLLLASLLCLLASSSGLGAAGDPWPGYRGPHASGRAGEGLPPGDLPLGFELRWQRDLGSGYAGIAVGADRLVTAAVAGDRDVVLAFDPEKGEELWRQELGPSYRGHDGSHDGPIATPAIAAGRVFALGAQGLLRALDLETGSPKWAVNLVADLGCEAPFYGFASSPVVAGNTVVLMVGGKAGVVAGFDVATGALRWRALEDEIFAQSPVLVEIGGRQQIVAIAAKKMAGLDPATGELLWSLEHGGQSSAMATSSSPLWLGGDRLFVKHDVGSSALVRVEPAEGGARATLGPVTPAMARSYSPPTYWEDTIFGYTARLLGAVDATTGEALWRSREPGDGFLVALGDQLVVLTKDGSLHLGPASREGWRETARLQVFEDLVWTPPSVAGNRIFARSLGGIARVDIVRARAALTAAAAPELPAPLRPLAEELRGAEAAAPVIDRFLAGRELPLVDGEDVVFLWRGAPGKDGGVAIAGDMIGMRREEPMHRVEGTDLWWWATRLDRRARISYVFFVDDTPLPDPSHSRRVRSSILGPDMNWQRGKPLDLSWFAMPEWPGRVRLESFELAVEAPGENGEPVKGNARLHVWLPPGYADSEARYPVVFVHHPAAHTLGGWPETLEREVGRSVSPLIAVFVEPARIPRADKVFVEQLVPAIDARYRTRTDREGRANVAMGWQSGSVARMTFTHPERFGLLGIQSFYGMSSELDELRKALEGLDAARAPLRIYYEWGRWDLISPHEAMNMRATGRAAWELLRQHGLQPVGGEVWDSTDWASWRNRTDVLLQTLYPLPGAEPSRLGQWTAGGP